VYNPAATAATRTPDTRVTVYKECTDQPTEKPPVRRMTDAELAWKKMPSVRACEMTLAEALEEFKDDPDKLRWVVEQSQSHKEYDAEKAAEGGEKPE